MSEQTPPPKIGTRVYVTGTRHNGFRGAVTEKPEGWSLRSIAVQLDEFDEPIRLYAHNLMAIVGPGEVRHL